MAKHSSHVKTRGRLSATKLKKAYRVKPKAKKKKARKATTRNALAKKRKKSKSATADNYWAGGMPVR